MIRYGDVFLQNEQEYSTYNFERADTEMLFQHFKDAEKECPALLDGDKAAACCPPMTRHRRRATSSTCWRPAA